MNLKTYHGKPCKNCGGTLRYYMRRQGVPFQPGPCVACVCGRVRPHRTRKPTSPDNSKPKSERIRLGPVDPTIGAAFPASRAQLMAGR
jgi:hypothetical protein